MSKTRYTKEELLMQARGVQDCVNWIKPELERAKVEYEAFSNESTLGMDSFEVELLIISLAKAKVAYETLCGITKRLEKAIRKLKAQASVYSEARMEMGGNNEIANLRFDIIAQKQRLKDLKLILRNEKDAIEKVFNIGVNACISEQMPVYPVGFVARQTEFKNLLRKKRRLEIQLQTQISRLKLLEF